MTFKWFSVNEILLGSIESCKITGGAGTRLHKFVVSALIGQNYIFILVLCMVSKIYLYTESDMVIMCYIL